MATTTNFGWETPDDTDLVKDGAAAMRTLGNSIDTSFVDLKGGTTGQMLVKASGTDLDYTWTDQNTGDITGVTAGTGISGGGTSGTVTVTNSMATAIDAKGDLIVGTGADTFSRLAVGTNNYILTADSAEATGMKWAAAAGGGGMTLLSTTTLSGSSTTISSISGAYKALRIIVTGVTNATADGKFSIKYNGDNNDAYLTLIESGTATQLQNSYYQTQSNVDRTNAVLIWDLTVFNYANTSYVTKSVLGNFEYFATGSTMKTGTIAGSQYKSVAIDSLVFANSGGNFTAGTVLLYGVN